MADKTPDKAPDKAPAKARRDPLIKTLAELDSMTPAEKQAFRDSGGTSIQNPSED